MKPIRERNDSAPRFSGKEDEPLAREATLILRAEMARRGVSYKALAEAMSQIAGDPKESTQTLINKVNRGRFSFAFFLRVCRALGVTRIDLADLPPTGVPARRELEER